ncbi:hypothetical protein DPMN_122891 [Dreissena polymorpha]|uniref:Uncharacterized protein n=1 Tax=Dreissena polymorpha TaxID=45954 RepID=A0A9D4GPC2_DREPO|nr:hypothetical protein DPMN_122891 [Dreissena polymorpha]
MNKSYIHTKTDHTYKGKKMPTHIENFNQSLNSPAAGLGHENTEPINSWVTLDTQTEILVRKLYEDTSGDNTDTEYCGLNATKQGKEDSNFENWISTRIYHIRIQDRSDNNTLTAGQPTVRG